METARSFSSLFSIDCNYEPSAGLGALSLFFTSLPLLFAAFSFPLARSLQSPDQTSDRSRSQKIAFPLGPVSRKGQKAGRNKRVRSPSFALCFFIDPPPIKKKKNRNRIMVTQTSLEALDAARAEVKLAGEGATADQLRNYLRLVRK